MGVHDGPEYAREIKADPKKDDRESLPCPKKLTKERLFEYLDYRREVFKFKEDIDQAIMMQHWVSVPLLDVIELENIFQATPSLRHCDIHLSTGERRVSRYKPSSSTGWVASDVVDVVSKEQFACCHYPTLRIGESVCIDLKFNSRAIER